MKKFIIPVIICCAVIIVAGGFFWYLQKHNSGSGNNQVNKPLIISSTNDQFTLTADTQDSLGIDPKTTFTLLSTDKINKETVASNLVVEPKFAYKIESSDNNSFTLTPKEPLQANTVYSFAIVTSQLATGQKRDYTWAYQIKDTFKILSSVPRNKATNVPVDTGIEIAFSSENFQDYQKYFEINPKVEGQFEQIRKTLIFKPKTLANSKIYTVTIKKGLPLNNSTETLGEDYTFQFETEQTNQNSGYLTFANSFSEFGTADIPALSINEYDTGISKLPVTVWQFNNYAQFSDAVLSNTMTVPYWAYYARQNNSYPTDSLQKKLSFETELKTNPDMPKYFEFPEKLTTGYYLVEASWNNKKIQTWLQITDLTATFEGSKTKSLIWLHDLSTNKPAEGAIITFSADKDLKSKTDGSGLAIFDSPAQLIESNLNESNYQTYFFTATAGTQQLLIPTERNFSWGFGMGGGTVSQNDYWSHIYTNRVLYQPSDHLKFWGVAKKRSGQTLDQITAELTAMNYYGPEFDRSKQLISTQNLQISSFGTFTGDIQFTNLAPASYRLTIYDGDTEITSSYITVQTYTKPSYSINVSTPKKAIFAGDNAIFSIQASFFDGTPVGKLELKYTGSLGEGMITTDENGQATVSLATKYSEQNTFYPTYQYFSIAPTRSEITNIYSDAYIYTFGPHYQITMEAKPDGAISGSISDITLDKINAEAKDFLWDYQGQPQPNIKTHLKIYEEYYDKTESGSYYDYINKKTVKTYNYMPRENLAREADVTTDLKGEFTYNYTFDSSKNYKIVTEARDADNRLAQATDYLYLTANFGGYGFNSYYYLDGATNNANQIQTYQPGDEVKLTFKKDEVVLPETTDQSFVYFKDQNGLFDVTTSSAPRLKFNFKDSYSPNIYAYGIYFDGRTYHLTQPTNLTLDKTVKKLDLKITPDKNEYRPGDKAHLDISVKDASGQPVSAEVNVSIIDEALASIQWDNQSTILDSLYRSLQPSVTYSYATHKELSRGGAEGGGCFTGDTEITMSDGSKKMIKDVQYGDSILTRQSETQSALISTQVLGTTKQLVNQYLTINGKLEVTPVHIIYLNGKWQPASQAKIGDYLLSESGEKILIIKIDHHYRPVEVYNLHTSINTFLANGVYVHNEKSGGRNNFQDVAYFNSVTTDKKGSAQVEFTLPDNITSWRTTVQAVTKDLEANGMQTALIVTQPFFIDVTAADTYLAADKPIMKLRGFGKGLTATDTIDYEVAYPELNKTEKFSGSAFKPVSVTLPSLAEGTHSVIIKATSSNSLSDIQTKKISITPTHLTSGQVSYYLLDDSTKIKGSDTNNTTVTFLNKERGQYYNLLQSLKNYQGDRVDQQIAQSYSQKLLTEYFKDQGTAKTVDFTNYQQFEGGISVLPYSSSELLLTAKVLETANDSFDTKAAKNYFYTFLNSSTSNKDEIVYSLLGLANIHEPVLQEINNFLSNQSPTPQQTIYLARAVANLGAGEYAKTLISDILNAHGEKADPYIRLNLSNDQDKNIELTYQAAIIAGQTSMPDAEKLFNYAIANPAVYNLNTLEELAYLDKTLPLLSGSPVSFSYTLDNQSKTASLANNETLALVLTPSQVNSLSFSKITGQVGAVATYDQPIVITSEKQDSNIKITRNYSVNGKTTALFKESDIVKITLEPAIASKAIDNEYQITDYLPAGLKILTDPYTRNLPFDQMQRFPYEINGQAIKFWSGKPATSFYYYAIVVGQGEFKADAPAIQGFVTRDSKAYGTETTITIQ